MSDADDNTSPHSPTTTSVTFCATFCVYPPEVFMALSNDNYTRIYDITKHGSLSSLEPCLSTDVSSSLVTMLPNAQPRGEVSLKSAEHYIMGTVDASDPSTLLLECRELVHVPRQSLELVPGKGRNKLTVPSPEQCIVAVKGNRRFAAVACSDGTVHVVDNCSWNIQRTVRMHSAVDPCVLALSLRVLAVPAVEGVGGSVALYDANGSATVKETHRHPLKAMTFDKSGTLLVTASEAGTKIHVYAVGYSNDEPRVPTLRLMHNLHRGYTPGDVFHIAVSPMMAWVAVSTAVGTTHMFHIDPFRRTEATDADPVINAVTRIRGEAGLTKPMVCFGVPSTTRDSVVGAPLQEVLPMYVVYAEGSLALHTLQVSTSNAQSATVLSGLTTTTAVNVSSSRSTSPLQTSGSFTDIRINPETLHRQQRHMGEAVHYFQTWKYEEEAFATTSSSSDQQFVHMATKPQ